MLAEVYDADGKQDRAEPLLAEPIKGRQRVPGAERPETLASMETLGIVRGHRKNFAEAEQLFCERSVIRTKTMPDSWQRFDTECQLGICLVGQKSFSEAEPILLSAFRGMKAREKDLPPKSSLPSTGRTPLVLSRPG
jgi:eukaryotic-like serine/threonine-protein kinase